MFSTNINKSSPLQGELCVNALVLPCSLLFPRIPWHLFSIWELAFVPQKHLNYGLFDSIYLSIYHLIFYFILQLHCCRQTRAGQKRTGQGRICCSILSCRVIGIRKTSHNQLSPGKTQLQPWHTSDRPVFEILQLKLYLIEHVFSSEEANRHQRKMWYTGKKALTQQLCP